MLCSSVAIYSMPDETVGCAHRHEVMPTDAATAQNLSAEYSDADKDVARSVLAGKWGLVSR